MSSESSSSSPSSSTDLNPNPNTSIDQSLDAIATQLSSISLDRILTDSVSGSILSDNYHQLDDDGDDVEEKGGADGSASSSSMWRNDNSVEVEGSPSSSGYAGGRGSSSATTSVSGIEEIEEDDGVREEVERRNEVDGGVGDLQAEWLPGKRHFHEVSLMV